ncbi:MAG: phosphodiester glycosidase family protein [Myxococcota bacterium]
MSTAAKPSERPRSIERIRATLGTRWARAAILAATGSLAALWAARETLVDAARAVGQTLAGVGELEWRPPGGDWLPIEPGDAARRHWGVVDAFLAPGWRRLAPGLETADLELRRSPNPQHVDVFLARVDPRGWRFRVWGRPDWAPGDVGELADEAGLALAVNASYFAEDGPIGLVVEDGRLRKKQARNRAAHFLVPTGDRPRVVNEKRTPLPPLDAGFQGFPSIMTAGRTFSYMRVGGRGFDVWKVDRRSAACVDREGRVVLLVTDTVTNGLSFDELATVFGGLGCWDAMAFDGGSSTGMALRVGEPRDIGNLEPVPVILGVEAR